MAYLVWKTNDGKTHSYTLTGKETLIGRDPGCAILLDDERASRRHCSILQVEKSFILQDLGSRNGTRVDHKLVSRSVLHDGSKITVGKITLEFLAVDESKNIPLFYRTNWQLPEDWSLVEAVVDASLNPTDTVLAQQNRDTPLISSGEEKEFDILRRSHNQLQSFYKISSLLGEIRDEKELLVKLLEEVFQIFPVEQGFIFLRDRQTGAMMPVAARRLTDKKTKALRDTPPVRKQQSPSKSKLPERKIVISQSILEQVIRDKKAVLIRDAGLDERFAGAQSIVTVQLQSAMCVPFISKGEVIGVIQVATFSQKNAFTEEDLRLLTVICNQTAIWLENIQLFGESQRKVTELSSLFEIGKAISANLYLDKVLELIMQKSLELIQAESGSLMLLDDDKQALKIKASVGLSKEIVESVRWKMGDGIAGWVAKHEQPLLLKDKITDTRFVGFKRAENVKDALSVPLIIGGEGGVQKVIGVLNANNKIGDKTFDSADLHLLSAFATHAAIAIENARLYSSLNNMYLNTVKGFASAIEARDPYTRGHCDRLSGYALALGKELGMTPHELEALRGASLLHDVGKIGIKEEILQKGIALSPEEYENMKRHPVIGKQILESIPAMKDILPLIYHHQERFDGTGYPDGLAGDDIPFGARIIAVVDAFDAMTSNRPYRKQLPLQKAIDELKKNAGTQFEPLIVEKFVELIQIKGWSETQEYSLEF